MKVSKKPGYSEKSKESSRGLPVTPASKIHAEKHLRKVPEKEQRGRRTTKEDGCPRMLGKVCFKKEGVGNTDRCS